MPRVKLDEILSDHESDIRNAVRDVLMKYAPAAASQYSQITRELIRAIDRRTNTWTRARENHVDTD
jgi:hypothetical protein